MRVSSIPSIHPVKSQWIDDPGQYLWASGENSCSPSFKNLPTLWPEGICTSLLLPFNRSSALLSRCSEGSNRSTSWNLCSSKFSVTLPTPAPQSAQRNKGRSQCRTRQDLAFPNANITFFCKEVQAGSVHWISLFVLMPIICNCSSSTECGYRFNGGTLFKLQKDFVTSYEQACSSKAICAVLFHQHNLKLSHTQCLALSECDVNPRKNSPKKSTNILDYRSQGLFRQASVHLQAYIHWQSWWYSIVNPAYSLRSILIPFTSHQLLLPHASRHYWKSHIQQGSRVWAGKILPMAVSLLAPAWDSLKGTARTFFRNLSLSAMSASETWPYPPSTPSYEASCLSQ